MGEQGGFANLFDDESGLDFSGFEPAAAGASARAAAW